MKPERGLKRALQIVFGLSTASLGVFLFLCLYFCSNPADENAIHAGNEASILETEASDGDSEDSDFSVSATDDATGRNDNDSKGADSGEEIRETEAPLVNLIMVGDMLMHLRVTQSGKMEDKIWNCKKIALYSHFEINITHDICTYTI